MSKGTNIDIESLKSIQLDILDTVHAFCQANGLNYSLAYGTLIGAIRHQGYIPWDDDIDIFMPRKDYDIFVSQFNSFNPSYEVMSRAIDKNFPFYFSKVKDNRTVLLENASYNYPMGVNIDVFPLDFVSDNKAERLALFKKMKRFVALRDIKLMKLGKRSLVKNFALALGKIVLLPFSVKTILDWMDKERLNNTLVSVTYGDLTAIYGEKVCAPEKCFEAFEDVKFEDRIY